MIMKNNILVIGGTGKTGRKVAQGLESAGQSVRLGTRSGIPSFDWNDPTTWPAALEHMEKVYISYYPDLAVPGALEAIEGLSQEARNAGVKKAVLLSGKGEKEAERCEKVIAKSGMDFTLIRASWFNQNFSESFLLDPILAGVVSLPMSHVRIPFADTTDIAEVAVKALLDDGTNGRTYEITGPRALTFEEVVSEIAEETGRQIHFQPISLDQYSSLMKSSGVPSDYIWLFDYLFREVLGNEKNQVVTDDVERLLGRKATDFSTYVQRTAPTGVWNEVIPHSV